MSQTEILAIWGAVTGTIGTVAGLLGLWLRFRQHSLDRQKLNCESSFNFHSPNSPQHKITIRSVGRRPVSIDKVQYFIIPKNWKQRLIKSWLHKKGRWVWNQEPNQKVKLSEGEKSEISISLPKGLEITDIYKVSIIDQAGNSWPVLWKSASKLKKIATQETIDEVTEESGNRTISLTGYRLGEKYYLETKFGTKPAKIGAISGRSFWFSNLKEYKEKFSNIQGNQLQKYLSGEIEELM